MKELNFALLGLGNISMGYDLESVDGVRTHFKAINNKENCTILLGVDPDSDKRSIFESLSNKPAYPAITLISNELSSKTDVVVLCTPTTTRRYDLEKTLDTFQNLKYIIMEKPLALTLEDAIAINELLSAKNLKQKVYVNYMRRVHPSYLELKDKIRNNLFGKLIKAHINYSGGLINMGSHFIDLLLSFTGESDFKVIKVNNKEEFENGDFKADAYLEDKNCSLEIESNKDNVFEINLIFEKVNIGIKDSGKAIFYNDIKENVDLSHYQEVAFSYFLNCVNKNIEFESNFQSAYKTLDICSAIRKFS